MTIATTFRLGLLAAATTLGCTAASAETISLRVSTGFPAVHDTTTQIVMPWIEELSARSGVDIETTLFAAGSSLGALDRQLDQLQRGLVDVAVGLAVVPRGRMPRLGLIDLPFLGADSREINMATSGMLGTEFAPDLEGMEVVNVFIDCSVLHTVDRPIHGIADIRGLRLRVPSAMGAAMVAAVGGIPVAMPQSEIYESLQRNVIDGAITPWDVINSLNLGEVLHHHTDNVLFCGQLWFGFNERTYQNFPEALRAAFDELRGDYAVNLAQGVYEASRVAAHETIAANGDEITHISDEDMAEWATLVQPDIETFLNDTEASVSDIRAIYDTLRARIAAQAR
ncbi:MAG: TRAP transporter substrate-binding protein DctP [Rhodobacter sp.]|nr:TRAP transporter substrate-binding protein DctP [Paracoccaceae bacterium]MCC0075463.1 TRAP transporter substrate-binding protein DctP [Rhodobacter sp.]